MNISASHLTVILTRSSIAKARWTVTSTPALLFNQNVTILQQSERKNVHVNVLQLLGEDNGG